MFKQKEKQGSGWKNKKGSNGGIKIIDKIKLKIEFWKQELSNNQFECGECNLRLLNRNKYGELYCKKCGGILSEEGEKLLKTEGDELRKIIYTVLGTNKYKYWIKKQLKTIFKNSLW